MLRQGTSEGQNRNQDTVKEIQGMPAARLPAFQETASQMTRKTVTIPVPHAMITWAISSVTGANRIPPYPRPQPRTFFLPQSGQTDLNHMVKGVRIFHPASRLLKNPAKYGCNRHAGKKPCAVPNPAAAAPGIRRGKASPVPNP